MELEHLALQVEDPAAMADWLEANLGMKVVRAGEPPISVRFIVDDGGRTMLELYRNPTIDVPDYRNQSPIWLHIAFASHDVRGDFKKLLVAGASVVDGPTTTAAGDELAMLRDPWGVPIQLVKRAEKMK